MQGSVAVLMRKMQWMVSGSSPSSVRHLPSNSCLSAQSSKKRGVHHALRAGWHDSLSRKIL